MARPDSEWASTSCNSPVIRLRSASAAAAASASRASWSWASSSSVRSWLWRPRRMNWPVTASSRHSSTAVTADWAAGCPVRPTATASAAVIAPAAAAAGTDGSLTAAIHTPRLAAISTGPCGCKTASATPQPPIRATIAACAAGPRRAHPTLIAVSTAAAYTTSSRATARPAPCRAGAG